MHKTVITNAKYIIPIVVKSRSESEANRRSNRRLKQGLWLGAVTSGYTHYHYAKKLEARAL